MRILYKQPGEDPRSMVIPNELGVMQQLVGGHIETLRISDNGILVMNEEGKLLGLEPNFYHGEDFASLPDDEAAEISRIMRGGFDI